MSITSSIPSAVFTRRRFLKYQVKSETNCTSSRPCITISSSREMAPVTSPLRTTRSSLLNTSVSTAPSTSSTLS